MSDTRLQYREHSSHKQPYPCFSESTTTDDSECETSVQECKKIGKFITTAMVVLIAQAFLKKLLKMTQNLFHILPGSISASVWYRDSRMSKRVVSSEKWATGLWRRIAGVGERAHTRQDFLDLISPSSLSAWSYTRRIPKAESSITATWGRTDFKIFLIFTQLKTYQITIRNIAAFTISVKKLPHWIYHTLSTTLIYFGSTSVDAEVWWTWCGIFSNNFVKSHNKHFYESLYKNPNWGPHTPTVEVLFVT